MAISTSFGSNCSFKSMYGPSNMSSHLIIRNKGVGQMHPENCKILLYWGCKNFMLVSTGASARPVWEVSHLAHACGTPRVNCCNALNMGLYSGTTFKIHLLQNAAARLLTGASCADDVPFLPYQLAQLPVHFQVQFTCPL